MGAFTSVLMAAGIGMQAVGQYKSGQDARAAADYNAAIYQQQASAIEVKKGLTREQWDRSIRKLEGAQISAVASSGHDMSGSFLAVMNDSLTQAYLDKNTEIYNLNVEKSLAMSGASESTRAGVRYAQTGSIKAVSTLLTEGNDWYAKYGGFGKTTAPKGGK